MHANSLDEKQMFGLEGQHSDAHVCRKGGALIGHFVPHHATYQYDANGWIASWTEWYCGIEDLQE